jgi:Tfp pilus assembly protein PilO
VAELTNNHKTLLRASVAGGVLLSGLFGWLGYQDFQARAEALEQCATKRTELDKADAQIREIPKLEEKILVLRETVNQYVRILPDDKEINLFVEKLTEFAQRSEVKVKKLDDEDVRARSGRNQQGATAAFDRVVYKLSIEGNTEQLLNFMDLFENHERFVRIGSFKIEHRDNPQEKDPMSVLHQIDLDLETYVYNAKVRSKDPVVIPQEPQKLERLKATGLVGADGAADLVLASYHHEPGMARRDLFYDPRLAGAQKLRATEEERATQRGALEDMIARLQRIASDMAAEAKIDNMVRKLQAREKVNHDLVAMGADITKARTDHTFTVEELKNRFDKEVDAPFQKMVEGRDLNLEAAPVLGQQVEEHVQKMRAAMGDSRWEEVVTLHDEVTRMSAAVKGADIRALMKDADGMNRTAKAHLDFNARPISFGGAVCFQNDPAHAVVIINGRSYSPGESVDQELVVRTVTPSSITFEFRGVTLTQSMKSSAPHTATATTQAGTPGATPNPGGQKRKKG